MGNTASAPPDIDPAGDIVTVSAAGASTAHAEDGLLQRLKQLPQVHQVAQARADDQVWQELAAYTQGKLNLPPESTLRLIATYKNWSQQQAENIREHQHGVNTKIAELDELATRILNQSMRSQQSIEEGSRLLASTTATQQQMDDIAARLSACAAKLETAKSNWGIKSSPPLKN